MLENLCRLPPLALPLSPALPLPLPVQRIRLAAVPRLVPLPPPGLGKQTKPYWRRRLQVTQDWRSLARQTDLLVLAACSRICDVAGYTW